MYLNYRNFSVEFREDSGEFRCFYTASGEEHESEFLRDGSMYLTAGGRRYELAAYRCRKREITPALECLIGSVSYADGPEGAPPLTITFRLDEKSLRFGMMARAELHVSGLLVWGAEPERATFGVRLDSDDRVLRAACGPAVASCDDALFDRLTDRALEFRSAGSSATTGRRRTTASTTSTGWTSVVSSPSVSTRSSAAGNSTFPTLPFAKVTASKRRLSAG